jgi:hypothetical protein
MKIRTHNLAARSFVSVIISMLLCSCGGSIRATGSADDAGDHPDRSTSQGDACSIVLASDYYQSCAADTDCALVGQVSFCPPGPIDNCPTFPISKSVVPQYMAALSDALASVAGQGSSCIANSVCCVQGQCSTSCPLPPLSPPAGADASSDAPIIPPGSVLCSSELGPVDAAVADAGSVSRCNPPQSCMQYNGGWTCCMNAGGGIAICGPT